MICQTDSASVDISLTNFYNAECLSFKHCFQIFCVHGGIPLPTHGEGMIAEINQLPVGLRQPMDEELAWELLWNDPLR